MTVPVKPPCVEPSEKAFYSYADLQRRWGVSKRTIQREVTRGKLRRSFIAGVARFSAATVQNYERLASRPRQSAA
jgi:hypothetical protein